MTFVSEAVRDKPVGLYILDDTAPFDDASGYDRAGSVSGTENHSISLISGAAFSQCADKNTILSFPSPIYTRGSESAPFTLEATARVVNRTNDYESQPYRENLATKPNAASFATGSDIGFSTGRWFGSSTGKGTYTIVSSASDGPTPYLKSYIRKAWTAVPAGNGDTGFETTAGSTTTSLFPVKLGDKVAVSSYIRTSSTSTKVANVGIYRYNASATMINTAILDGSSTNIGGVTSWTRIGGVYTVTQADIDAGVAFLRFVVDVDSGTTWAVGETLDATGLLIERTDQVKPYFDGTMPGYEWSGISNASISRTMTGVSQVNLFPDPSFVTNSYYIGNGAVTANTIPVDGRNAVRSTRQTTAAGGTYFARSNGIQFIAGNTYTIRFRYRANFNKSDIILRQSDKGQTNTLVSTTFSYSDSANIGWQQVSWTFTAQYASTGLSEIGVIIGTTGDVGTYNDIMDFMIVPGSYSGDFFDGSSSGAIWTGTANASASYMLVSNSDTQILSHTGRYDGISINGTTVSFGTDYLNTGSAKCSFDIEQNQAIHIIGTHTEDRNALFINGVLVAEVDISDEQKLDQYASSDNNLLTGNTTSSNGVMVNGLGMYPTALDEDSIKRHYLLVTDMPLASEVVSNFAGVTINPGIDGGDLFTDRWWQTASDWALGQMNGVAVLNDRLQPQFVGDVSTPGTWQTTIDLSSNDTTSISGMTAFWSGKGASVQASLDATTWADVENGKRLSIIPEGFDPTDKEVYIKVSFAGGIENDDSYIDNLNIVGIKDSTTQNIGGRTLSFTSASQRREYVAQVLHDNNGVVLDADDTMTISADTLTLYPARTLELWIKAEATAPTISISGTNYINGVASTDTLPVGEWALLHIVADADVTDDITITGPVQIGNIGIYDVPLTASDVTDIYNQYFSLDALRVEDEITITVPESTDTATIYGKDWTQISVS